MKANTKRERLQAKWRAERIAKIQKYYDDLIHPPVFKDYETVSVNFFTGKKKPGIRTIAEQRTSHIFDRLAGIFYTTYEGVARITPETVNFWKINYPECAGIFAEAYSILKEEV